MKNSKQPSINMKMSPSENDAPEHVMLHDDMNKGILRIRRSPAGNIDLSVMNHEDSRWADVGFSREEGPSTKVMDALESLMHAVAEEKHNLL